MRLRVALLASIAAILLGAQTGGLLLPTGWRVRPAGRQVAVDTLPMASALSPDGRFLLVLNSGLNPPSISVLDVEQGKEMSRTPVADAWLGLTFAPKGNLVYVGGGAQAAVFEFTFAGGKLTPARTFPMAEPQKRTSRDFVGDVVFSPDGRLLYAAELYQNSIAVINPQSGRVIERFKTGRRPYRILFVPDGRSFLVSCWADGMVLRHDADNGSIAAKFLLAPHPTDMIWVAGRPKPALEGETNSYVARVFVAASNTNSVRVLGVTEAGDIRTSEAVNLAMTPLQPAGMTPSALAVDSASNRLYVACSDENAVAVLDVSETQSRVLGYMPAGEYPVGVRTLAGGRLAILNGGGTMSLIDTPGPEALAEHSRTVAENTPYRDSKLEDAGSEDGNPVPSWPGDPTPIRHVIYVLINEGWTYDQLFADSTAPNLQKLAKEFVLLDNFRLNGGSLAEGYNWSVAAIAPDYVKKLSPGSTGGRRNQNDFGETEPAAIPPAGYLWTNARTAKVPFATYASKASSVEQVDLFVHDLAGFEKSAGLPRLVFVRLPSAGTADNDHAVGTLVAALSRSRFWPQSAIFILPAHTGRGRDSVDSRRAPAFVVSPFVKRRTVDSAPYNTTSMLRTVELLTGLQPMTQFDAAARPMYACFQSAADLAPYTAAERAR